MFNLYSKGCGNAVRVLVQAVKDDEPTFAVKDLCRRIRISESFTRKVFQDLVRRRILKAVHGPGGGYAFNPPAPGISLYKLIRAIDGENAFDHCVMGLPECHDRNPCVFHATWVKMKEDAIKRLSSQTLEDLAKSGRGKAGKGKRG